MAVLINNHYENDFQIYIFQYLCWWWYIRYSNLFISVQKDLKHITIVFGPSWFSTCCYQANSKIKQYIWESISETQKVFHCTYSNYSQKCLVIDIWVINIHYGELLDNSTRCFMLSSSQKKLVHFYVFSLC